MIHVIFCFFSLSLFVCVGHQLLSTGNTVDDIINAVASGLYRRSSKKRKESAMSTVSMLNIMPLAPPVQEMSVKMPLLISPPTPTNVMSISEQRSESKRGRGRRKRNDDLYWYEGDGLDDKINPSRSKKKNARTSSGGGGSAKKVTVGRTTAKLKFTHNYDALPPPQPPQLSPAKVVKTPIHPVPSFEDPDRLYCYCRCPYDEVSQMIGCDASDCPYEWFHFECVGISEAPEGTYYCPECRLRPKYRALFDEPFFQPQPPPQQII